ncbi:hypothetical protein TWF970_000162 [Orbilia oligospora]|uniref:Uncharacterized protein n=1 Tax=Orbilia oligospora TaxID=2813651 RepID=A0A7C8RHQ6_ORBOL|nr:hypothetical protein TWF970_000162 [Orbilia oligospora]
MAKRQSSLTPYQLQGRGVKGYTVINSFCKKTLIGRDAPRKVWTKVQNLYSSDGSRKRRDIVRGQFPDEGHLSGRLLLAKDEVSDEDSDNAVFSDTADD